ncbi:putative selenoprotein P-like [Apostichopus japonicus]|uniref:Putative selenoprotein P-like n=1 Tax=Stichopus japonicus TaxID=307972 RepID=A0A2G8JD62_STIJA|nr:putative selenoprotein P-like [Apostichopus japonicus]
MVNLLPFLVALLPLLSHAQDTGGECQLPPTWTITGGDDPMVTARGDFVVVMLMKLESLRSALVGEGYSDVTFMGVNLKGSWTSRYISILEGRVSFPVYQDTDALDIWTKLDGEKDDVLIYDRCGQLITRVRLPYGNSDVENAVRSAITGNSQCTCDST